MWCGLAFLEAVATTGSSTRQVRRLTKAPKWNKAAKTSLFEKEKENEKKKRKKKGANHNLKLIFSSGIRPQKQVCLKKKKEKKLNHNLKRIFSSGIKP
jgi:hypothetical protein